MADCARKLELARGVLARLEKTASGPADPQVIRQKRRVVDLEAALEQFNAAVRTFQEARPEAAPPRPGVMPAARPARELIRVTTPSYVVEPPDILNVEVLQALPGRPITGERLVKPDGTINLGYYGEVYVSGLTTAEIKEKVALHLRKYLGDEASGSTPPSTDRMGSTRSRGRH